MDEIPTVPTYYPAKPQPRERAWRNQRGKKTLLSLTLVWQGEEVVNSVGKFGVLRWHRRWASVNRKNFVAYRSKQALLISNVPVQRSRLHSKTLSQTSHGQVAEPVRVENLLFTVPD